MEDYRFKVIEDDIIPCDVDDTLVMHMSKSELISSGIRQIHVQDPIDPNCFILLGVNEPMVRIVKEEAVRGSFIWVWSKGGYQWALNVVTALELHGYVDKISTKPKTYLDDKDVSEWLKDRVYLKPNTVYKLSKPKEIK